MPACTATREGKKTKKQIALLPKNKRKGEGQKKERDMRRKKKEKRKASRARAAHRMVERRREGKHKTVVFLEGVIGVGNNCRGQMGKTWVALISRRTRLGGGATSSVSDRGKKLDKSATAGYRGEFPTWTPLSGRYARRKKLGWG